MPIYFLLSMGVLLSVGPETTHQAYAEKGALFYNALTELQPRGLEVTLRTEDSFCFASRRGDLPSFALRRVSHHRVGAAFDVNGAHFSESEVPARGHIGVLADQDADAQLFGSRLQARCEIDRI